MPDWFDKADTQSHDFIDIESPSLVLQHMDKDTEPALAQGEARQRGTLIHELLEGLSSGLQLETSQKKCCKKRPKAGWRGALKTHKF